MKSPTTSYSGSSKGSRVAAGSTALAVMMGWVALPPSAQAQFARGPTAEEIAKAEAASTPRTADGHPDLSGYWGAGVEFGTGKNNISEGGKKIEFDIQPPYAPRAGGPGRRGGGPGGDRAGGPGGGDARPTFKPEFEAKVKQFAVTDVDTDPSFTCSPAGIPRVGPPNEIFQGKGALAFLYETTTGDYRIVTTEGRKHDPNLDPSYYGDSVGGWEGDTLVIDSVNFTDDTWMAGGGYFHTNQLHVVERLNRKGNVLTYDVTTEDPGVLVKPWIQPTRHIVLGKAGTHVQEAPPCKEHDQSHMVDKYHITP